MRDYLEGSEVPEIQDTKGEGVLLLLRALRDEVDSVHQGPLQHIIQNAASQLNKSGAGLVFTLDIVAPMRVFPAHGITVG